MRIYWLVIEKVCAGIAAVQVAVANVPLGIGNVFCALANAARMKKIRAEIGERRAELDSVRLPAAARMIWRRGRVK